MNIRIACVGSIKEGYYTDAVAEYVKRISKYHHIDIIEVAEGRLPKNYSPADIDKLKATESANLAKVLKGYVVLLDIRGTRLDSVEFSRTIDKLAQNNSTITFVIGGSYGVSDEFKSKANYLLSFSDFTFPHQLMRVILVEQIYRAATIANNVIYHK